MSARIFRTALARRCGEPRMRNQVSSSTRCPRAHFSGSSSPSTSTAADRSPSLVLHPSRQVHLPHAHAPRSRSSAASAACQAPYDGVIGKTQLPAVVCEAIMGCDGCRRLREPWTQCRPCAPRSEPPRCGNNGWHRKGGASPFRPGPGGISIQSPHNPHTIPTQSR